MYKTIYEYTYKSALNWKFEVQITLKNLLNEPKKILVKLSARNTDKRLYAFSLVGLLSEINEQLFDLKIKDFLMREIETILENKLFELKLNIRYSIAKYSDCFEIVDFNGNNSYIIHLGDVNNDYDLMAERLINYLEDLALHERLNTKQVQH